MNPVPEIREFLHSAPFVPFDLHLSDGRAFRIAHPDLATITGRGRIIVEGETDEQTVRGGISESGHPTRRQ